MIYTPAQSDAIMEAINSVLLSNNGYAEVGNDTVVVGALKSAGFIVLKTRALFGGWTHKAYTKEGREAVIAEAREHAKPIKLDARPAYDFEGAILRRQEAYEV